MGDIENAVVGRQHTPMEGGWDRVGRLKFPSQPSALPHPPPHAAMHVVKTRTRTSLTSAELITRIVE